MLISIYTMSVSLGDNVSDGYKCLGLEYLFSENKDRNEKDETGLSEITFEYPPGIDDGNKIDFVEVWVSYRMNARHFSLLFRGNLDRDEITPQINIPLCYATAVKIRFFTSFDEGIAVLPRVTFSGVAEISETGVDPYEFLYETSFVVIADDVPVGEYYLSKDENEDGFAFEEDRFIDVHVTEKDSKNTVKTEVRETCYVNTSERLFANEIECNRASQGLEASEESYLKSYDIEHSYNNGIKIMDFYITDKLALDGIAVGVFREYNVFLPGFKRGSKTALP